MLGLLLINKPAGITSYGAVAKIKHLSGEKRIGHTGTLDPMATGVLPVFLGRATVLSSYLLMSDKGYTAKAKLGITTDTLDITGKTEEVKDVCVGDEELTRVLSSFVGESLQKPPMFSALKKDGQRLYDLARKGEKIDIPARSITVHSINLLSPLDKDNEFSFETTVSKGTYIRSLVRDIGEKLGTGATLTELVRTKTAGFKIEDCVNLNELTNENIKKYILPADTAVKHLKRVNVTEKQAVRFNNGGQLSLDRLNMPETENGEVLRVYGADAFLGLGAVDRENNMLIIKCLV